MIRQIFGYLACAVIVLSSTRGLLIVHFGFKPQITRAAAAALLCGLAVVSLYGLLRTSPLPPLRILRQAILVNCAVLPFYCILQIVIDGRLDFAMTYPLLVFPSIFLLLNISKRALERSIHLIAAATAFGVYYFFRIAATVSADDYVAAVSAIRPEGFEYSRIGDIILPTGYQGDHHDAANILVMCGAFYFCGVIRWRGSIRLAYMAAFLVVVFALMLTASAANIALLLASVVLTALLFLKRTQLFFLFAACVLAVILIAPDFVADYMYFVGKFEVDQRDLVGGGIFNSLDFASMLASLPAVVVGFGYAMKVPLIHSEVAFLKLLITYGVVPWLILICILFSPVRYLYRFRRSVAETLRNWESSYSAVSLALTRASTRAAGRDLVVSAIPVFTGVATLLHYGSLFRITSIGLFCVLMALFYQHLVSLRWQVSEAADPDPSFVPASAP